MHDCRFQESPVDIIALTSLLHTLATDQSGISIRLRMNEDPWPAQFSQVLVFAKHDILLAHMPTRTVINVPDLMQVSAFEIDRAYGHFHAFYTYGVRPQSISKAIR